MAPQIVGSYSVGMIDRHSVAGAEWRAPMPIDEGSAPPAVDEVSLDYTAFFLREFAPVVRTVTLMLRDAARAEEIAQDAFVQLYLGWAKISRYERPDAWVRRVAIRLAMRVIRRERLWALVRGSLVRDDASPQSQLDVPGAVRRLPTNQRVAIVLHYYEDRPVAEIATILGCAEATARVHLHRGRKRLAELLGEDDDVA